MQYRADFHVHSCLSPCASLEMSPSAIVRRARETGLDAIALTDHNCTFNLPAFATVCAEHGMACLYGVEVTTLEDVHVLCLFDQLDSAMELGARVYGSLPDIPHQPERFGDQPIVNEQDEILGFAEKLLFSASGYDISGLVEEVHDLNGLVIPAHIDRPAYGMVSVLGFLPDEAFDAVELSVRGDPALASGYPVVRNSDSHCLQRIGEDYSLLELNDVSVESVRAFFRYTRT